jgi:hypothetical protein
MHTDEASVSKAQQTICVALRLVNSRSQDLLPWKPVDLVGDE